MLYTMSNDRLLWVVRATNFLTGNPGTNKRRPPNADFNRDQTLFDEYLASIRSICANNNHLTNPPTIEFMLRYDRDNSEKLKPSHIDRGYCAYMLHCGIQLGFLTPYPNNPRNTTQISRWVTETLEQLRAWRSCPFTQQCKYQNVTRDLERPDLHSIIIQDADHGIFVANLLVSFINNGLLPPPPTQAFSPAYPASPVSTAYSPTSTVHYSASPAHSAFPSPANTPLRRTPGTIRRGVSQNVVASASHKRAKSMGGSPSFQPLGLNPQPQMRALKAPVHRRYRSG